MLRGSRCSRGPEGSTSSSAECRDSWTLQQGPQTRLQHKSAVKKRGAGGLSPCPPTSSPCFSLLQTHLCAADLELGHLVRLLSLGHHRHKLSILLPGFLEEGLDFRDFLGPGGDKKGGGGRGRGEGVREKSKMGTISNPAIPLARRHAKKELNSSPGKKART